MIKIKYVRVRLQRVVNVLIRSQRTYY